MKMQLVKKISTLLRKVNKMHAILLQGTVNKSVSVDWGLIELSQVNFGVKKIKNMVL